MSLWPTPVPSWFWTWARWYLGREEFAGHARDPRRRPHDAPATIPFWAWARLAVLVGKPIPTPPPPPVDLALAKARAMLSYCRKFTGPYGYGSEHDSTLADDNLDGAFDCSSSTSKLLYQFGLLGSDRAQVSGWFERWGEAGRGRYVTVHANDDHVWVEFTLPEGYCRFDTSPHGDGPRGARVRTRRRFDSTFVHRHPKGL